VNELQSTIASMTVSMGTRNVCIILARLTEMIDPTGIFCTVVSFGPIHASWNIECSNI